MSKIALALALLLGATSAGLAQSQPNFGPNGPARSDCFGEPYSGAVASRCVGGYWHHHRYHHRYYR